MKRIILVLVCLSLIGCASNKVNIEKVHLFAEQVTRDQTPDSPYRANVAQVKQILKLSNLQLDGKLYQMISREK